MKILITGASGNVGKNLVNYLKNSGHFLVLTGRTQNQGFSIDSEKYHYYALDITARKETESIIKQEKPEVIIHLAAVMGKECETDAKSANKINVQATRKLAEIAAKNNVKKFIFASSGAVYLQDEKKALSETDKLEPHGIYGQTKYLAEQELQKIAGSNKMAVAVLRIFNIYGPGFTDSLVSKIYHANSQNVVDIVDPDNFIRDYVYIDDICQIIALLIHKKWQGMEIFNIGSGLPRNTNELIKELSKYNKHIYTRLVPGISDRKSFADVSKLQNFLGFKPRQELVI